MRTNTFRHICLGLLWILSVVGAAGCAHSGQDSGTRAAGRPGVRGIIDLYQGPLNHLSAVRRGACPMSPPCSEYCRNVMEKHGFMIGWLMAVDRLLRCGRDEMDTATMVSAQGAWKAYDPPADNDFWWVPSPSRYASSLQTPEGKQPGKNE